MDKKQKDPFHESSKDPHISDDAVKKHKHETRETAEQVESSDRYYYAYGPYQSVRQDEASHTTTSTDSAGRVNSVQITPSTPVKSFSSSTQQDNLQGGSAVSGGRKGEVGQPMASQSDWNFKVSRHQRSIFFKVIFVSFILGVLVIVALTVASQRLEGSVPTVGQEGAGKTASSDTVFASDPRTVSPSGARSIPDMVEREGRAVVKLEVFCPRQDNQREEEDSWQHILREHPLFREFFRDYDLGEENQHRDKELVKELCSLGTGFLIYREKYKGVYKGYIVTNLHVVEQAIQNMESIIRVTLKDQAEPLFGKVLGTDVGSDLAMVEVEGKDPFPTVNLGDPDAVRVGNEVFAIGHPSALNNTVTKGIVSGLNRKIPVNGKAQPLEGMMQIDAAINPGNSGGPVLDVIQGKVIAISTANAPAVQGIGFATPINRDKFDLMMSGKNIPSKPQRSIGIGLTDSVKNNRLWVSCIDFVVPGSPAHAAGLEPGDIIVGIDGTGWATSEELKKQIDKKKMGDKIILQILRDGKKMNVKVEIGDKNQFKKQRDRIRRQGSRL